MLYYSMLSMGFHCSALIIHQANYWFYNYNFWNKRIFVSVLVMHLRISFMLPLFWPSSSNFPGLFLRFWVQQFWYFYLSLSSSCSTRSNLLTPGSNFIREAYLLEHFQSWEVLVPEWFCSQAASWFFAVFACQNTTIYYNFI